MRTPFCQHSFALLTTHQLRKDTNRKQRDMFSLPKGGGVNINRLERERERERESFRMYTHYKKTEKKRERESFCHGQCAVCVVSVWRVVVPFFWFSCTGWREREAL